MSQHPSAEGETPPGVPDPESRFRQKVVIWVLALILFLYWEPILHLLLELLHIVLEYAELGVEELLMHVFHLEEHDGQMVTAWIGLASFLSLAVWAYVATVRKIRRTFRSWSYFRSWLKVYFQEHWLSLSLILGGYIAYLVFF